MPAPKGNKQGFTSNPENRNSKGVRGPRVRKSELRKLIAKLSKMEDKAVENIENSIEGKEITKEQLSSSRWLVERIASLTTAAVNEEQRRNAIKQSLQENSEDTPDEDTSEGTTEKPVRFSLHMLPSKKED